MVAGAVSRLPNGPSGGGPEPADVYKTSVEEYRFQAQFNWSRTQYLLALNVGLLVAGAGLSEHGRSAALVFLLGMATAGLSAAAVHTQHDYYRAARDRMRRIENALAIPVDQRVDTTSTLGTRRRRVSVNEVVYLLLFAIGVAHGVGLVVVVYR